MITFKELDARLSQKLWTYFAVHHYDYGTTREKLADNSRRYLAVEDGDVVGFVAIRVHFGKQTGERKCWRSHKIATLPEHSSRWANVSDAIAQFVIDSGFEYRCTTPIPFALYRENNPRWRKVSESVERNLSSWLYLGSLPTPSTPKTDPTPVTHEGNIYIASKLQFGNSTPLDAKETARYQQRMKTATS